jgi:hypothetical protein
MAIGRMNTCNMNIRGHSSGEPGHSPPQKRNVAGAPMPGIESPTA